MSASIRRGRSRSRARNAGGAEGIRELEVCLVEERTGLLFRTSALMRERKFELMAWMVFEVGKNWAEADGDIAELIDFCDFYALEAIRLSQAKTPVQLPGERDWLRYIPLGVAW